LRPRSRWFFYVFEFSGNLKYFSQDLAEGEGTAGVGLSARVFAAQVELLTASIAFCNYPLGPPFLDLVVPASRGFFRDVADFTRWLLKPLGLRLTISETHLRPVREI